MKKLTKFAMAFLCGAFALGFTSCSDDDDKLPEGAVEIPASELSSAISGYISTIVNPTYTDLHNAAVELHTACVSLNAKRQAGNVSQADIDAACEAFKKARRFWEQSEAFLYGPATDDGIDPHIDSWPLDQTQMADALTGSGDEQVTDVIEGINGRTGVSGAQYVYNNNKYFDSTLGFHGLEFILFRNGANRLAADFNLEYEKADGLNTKGDKWEENARKLATVKMVDEAAFADAVSGDLQNMTSLLEYEWDGNATVKSYLQNNASWVLRSSKYINSSWEFTSGKAYGASIAAIGKGEGNAYDTWADNLANILNGGCQSIVQEVHEQKLGQAYRVATGHPQVGEEGADAADYIESPYSHRSFQDYEDNVLGVRNVLYGGRGASADNDALSIQPNSIMALLQKYYPEANTLNNALVNAINTLEVAKKSGIAFIDAPDNAQVKACMDAVEELDDALGSAATWCPNIYVR